MFKDTKEGTTHYQNDGCGEPAHNDIMNKEKQNWEERFIEQGANLEHDRWARWQRHMHSKFYEPKDWQNLKNNHLKVLPTELWDRWERQVNTPYSELPEEEKESDRKETRNYLPLIKQILLEHDRELKSILEKDLEKYSKQAVDSTDTKNLDEAIGICKYIGEKMKSLLAIDEEK